MSRYRKIDPRFWKDEKIIRFTPEEKLIALYLFTGQSNRIGLFSFSPGEAAEDIGTLPQTFAERFSNVCKELNLGWDTTFRVLYIPTWWKYNPPENANNVVGNLKDLDDVPKSNLIDLFAENTQHLAENLRETFTQTLAKRYPERYPKRSPSQEQEQEYKSGAKAPESSSNKRSRKLTRGAKAIPPNLQPSVSKIVARINELGGTNYKDDAPDALKQLMDRLGEGRTEAECLAIVEGRYAAWAGEPDRMEYFRPSTLFAKAHFEDYLQGARRQGLNGNNGHTKPAEVKDLGDGFIEVDGRRMDKRTAERRGFNATA